MNGLELLNHAIAAHQPSHVFALFSGGHDSLCATHAAMQSGKVNAVVHCNTGIGVELTRQFVRDTCKQFGWPLIEVRAKEDCGQDYWAIIRKLGGWPGPAMHNIMYRRLKERCLEKVERDHRQHYRDDRNRRRSRKILFVSGARSEESTRRMGTVEPMGYQPKPKRVWVAIHHDQTASDQLAYLERFNLPRNPVKQAMCMSGECLCGAFAHKGELREWVHHFGDDPGVQELLRNRDTIDCPWDWDEEPPKWWIEQKRSGQMSLLNMTPDREQFLCTRCHKRQEIVEDAA